MAILAVAVAFFIVENLLDKGPIDVQPAIVVLPFEAEGREPDAEQLPVAIAEGLYTSLARIPQLVVSAWPTVMRLADEGAEQDEIVATLNAANFMRGALASEGDRLRLMVEIVETESGQTIWRDTYVGTTAEIFAFQYEIVAAAAESLQLGATGVLHEPPEINAEASRLVRQARLIMLRTNMPNQTSVAIELLERAIEIDPDYPPAILALGLALWTVYMEEGRSEEERYAVYRDFEERVFAMDHEYGRLNAYKAWELFWEDGFAGHANQHVQIALRTGLNDPEVLRMFAGFARRTGHSDAAVWFGKRLIAVDPTCENCIWQDTENLFYAGRFDEAIEAKKRFQAFGGGGHANHAYMLLRMGQPEAALELIESVESRGPVHWLYLKAMTYHALGDQEMLAEYLSRIESRGGVEAQVDLAHFHTFAGEIDLAFEALDSALEMGGHRRLLGQVFLPHWDNLRDDPRWTELRGRLGMSGDKLAKLDFSPVLQYER